MHIWPKHCLLFALLIFTSVSGSAQSEELAGQPAFEGQDFPRIISGYSVTEADYAIYFRDCAVALFLMESPIRDADHLRLALQLKAFIQGAAHVAAREINYDQYVNLVRSNCVESDIITLADGVLAASREARQ